MNSGRSSNLACDAELSGKSQAKFYLVVVMVGLLVAGCAAPSSSTRLALPSCFSDNMVLQRAIPGIDACSIWGWGEKGDRVVVAFQGRTFPRRSGLRIRKTGVWEVRLEGLAPSYPEMLVVNGNNNQIVLRNVAVGDVWIIGTRSNALVPFPSRLNPGDLSVSKFDRIRFLVAPPTSLQKGNTLWPYLPWRVFQPDSQMLDNVSSVPFHFGVEVSKDWPDVTLGIIETDSSFFSSLPADDLNKIEKKTEFRKVAGRGGSLDRAWQRTGIEFDRAMHQWQEKSDLSQVDPNEPPFNDPEPQRACYPHKAFDGNALLRLGSEAYTVRGAFWCQPVRQLKGGLSLRDQTSPSVPKHR